MPCIRLGPTGRLAGRKAVEALVWLYESVQRAVDTETDKNEAVCERDHGGMSDEVPLPPRTGEVR